MWLIWKFWVGPYFRLWLWSSSSLVRPDCRSNYVEQWDILPVHHEHRPSRPELRFYSRSCSPRFFLHESKVQQFGFLSNSRYAHVNARLPHLARYSFDCTFVQSIWILPSSFFDQDFTWKGQQWLCKGVSRDYTLSGTSLDLLLFELIENKKFSFFKNCVITYFYKNGWIIFDCPLQTASSHFYPILHCSFLARRYYFWLSIRLKLSIQTRTIGVCKKGIKLMVRLVYQLTT